MPSPELRARFVWAGGVIYLLMFLGAVYWNQQLEQPRSFLVLSDVGTRAAAIQTARNLGIGVAAGLAVVLLFKLLDFVPALQALEEEIAKLLGEVDWRTAFYLALFSSVGEEALFRGAMQNAWGLHWTCLAFGSMHVLNQRVWFWMVLAWGMGYVLGWLYIWTGDLAAPIACHFVINFINLQIIGRRAARMGYR